MKKQTKQLRQILAITLIFGFASLTLTGCDDGITDNKPVAVSVTGVALNEKAAILLVGGTETLTTTITPSNAANKAVLWSSSNSAVATVSSTGLVSGIAVGKVTITVTTVDGGKTDTCIVEVSAGSAPDATPITSAEIIVIAPAIGAAPVTTASGSGNFTVGAVSWSPSPDKFQAGTVYTVSILLTANQGFTFTGLSSTKINGEDATVANNIGSAVLISYAFSAMVEAIVPDKVISDRFLANTYTGNDKDRIKYSYTYNGYDFYYIYLGQMSNIPLYSFDSQRHSVYDFDYSVTNKEETTDKVENAISNSSQTAVKTVQENTTSTKQGVNVSAEMSVRYGAGVLSAEAKLKVESKREDFVQNTVTNSTEYTTSLTNTVKNGTEFAVSKMFTRTYRWGATDFPQGYYRYTMFGVSDVYLYVIRDHSTLNIVSFEFMENVIPQLYSWDLEYTKELPFEKKDASGFEFDISFLDNLPEPKDSYNEFLVTNSDEWNRVLALIKNSGSGTATKPNEYTITVSGDVAIPGGTENSFGSVANIVVTLNGNGKLYLNSQGSLLNIGGDQTVCINSANLTLQGLKSGQNGSSVNNNRTIIYVNSNGKLELKDGNISGNNTSGNGGGVHILNGGTFTMNGGTISGNNGGQGGGAYIYSNSTFTMNRGTIGNNISSNGGGVYIYDGTFTMNGGSISENIAVNSGGGVLLYSGSIFTMNGDSTINKNRAKDGGGVFSGPGCTFSMKMGTISDNTSGLGGGVHIDTDSIFTMMGGTITKNTAGGYGGGIHVRSGGSFTKTGGTITGYGSDIVNGNSVNSSIFEIDKGHAVNVEAITYVFFGLTSKRRNWRDTTAGPTVILDASKDGRAGGWDN